MADRSDESDEMLSLQEAADALGVHYMTAYRNVRLGVLPAHKSGSKWLVRRQDLDLYRERRRERGSAGTDGDGADREWGRAGRTPWAQRLQDRLLAGDSGGAWGVVSAAMAAGADARAVYRDMLVPAMFAIGESWSRGDISVADEHQATAVALRLIGRLSPSFSRPGRSRGTVVVCSPQGERHSLPTAIFSDLLRGHGYEVYDLGADLPANSLAARLGTGEDVTAVCLGVTTRDRVPAASETVAAVRAATSGRVPVLVGGSAIDAGVAARLGADAYVKDADEAARWIESHR